MLVPIILRVVIAAIHLLIAIPYMSLAAEKVTFNVVDQNGTPVKEAVVELIPTLATDLSMPNTRQVMDQLDKQFTPRTLLITRGDSVAFPNSDNIRHHVYSFSPAKRFEIPLYAGTPGTPELFDKSGVVVIGCNIHDSMIGFIYVAASPFAGLTDDQGFTSIENTVDQPNMQAFQALILWHPQLSLNAQDTLSFKFEDLQQSPDGTISLTMPFTLIPTNTD